LGKRDPRDEQRGRSKFRWLAAFIIVAFAVLTGRLFGLQFFEYENYSQYAQENQLQRERIVSPRGLIMDRDGEVLVDNVPSFDVVMPWRTGSEVRQAVTELNTWVVLDTTAIFERFESWRRRNAGIPFPIVQDADKLLISFVRENQDRFPKLRVQTNARRRYRRGAFAAHLLGYVGEVSDDFLAQTNTRGYLPGDIMGKTGIEGVCESYLRGEDGQRVVAVNAWGTVLGELTELLQPPAPGRDVTLTIDVDIQQQLEDLIEPYGSGAAVVMNVEDGSLLAAVSMPLFDPNSFALGIKQEEWTKLNTAEDKPLFNRFLQATYPPGSTLKVVSAYTVFTEQLVSPRERLVYCTGAHRFGNRVFKCWRSWGHGYMNLYDAIVQSCDTYFYKVAEMMDVDALAEGCREFGLGSRTGIDLPNETQGLVPDREYYNRRYGKGKWTQGLVLNNIIGQGEYLTSVLHMVRVAAAIGNGGYRVQPHVIKQIEGEPTGVYPRKKIRRLAGYTLNYLRAAMEGAVNDEDGTARAFRMQGVRLAGKTGTSQNPHGEDHALFIGYGPAEKPEIAIAVVVENAGHGGSVAAPIAGALFRDYFAPPDSLSVLSRSQEPPKKAPGGDPE
jgi:penicillin-binding protein 2